MSSVPKAVSSVPKTLASVPTTVSSVPKATVALADGRALTYFGAIPQRPADFPDRRQLPATRADSEARWDSLLSEWVVIASHRQDRTFQPAAEACPLCPSSAGSLTEIPAPEYEVVVVENRFPTLATTHGRPVRCRSFR